MRRMYSENQLKSLINEVIGNYDFDSILDTYMSTFDFDSVIAGYLTANPIDIATIVDAEGNNRFIEGQGEITETEGFTIEYNRWSLSGTHLMIVLGGTIDNGTVVPGTLKLAKYAFPDWIKNKIVPIVGTVIDSKQFYMYASNFTNQQVWVNLLKEGDGLKINFDAITLTADRRFRIQFDLLIDNEPSE